MKKSILLIFANLIFFSSLVFAGAPANAVNISFINGPVDSKYMVGEAVNPRADANFPCTVSAYMWDFGEGATPSSLTSANPIPGPITYNSPGLKTISVTVSLSGCTVTDSFVTEDSRTVEIERSNSLPSMGTWTLLLFAFLTIGAAVYFGFGKSNRIES